jgi:hypothetical protein
LRGAVRLGARDGMAEHHLDGLPLGHHPRV